VPLFEPPETSEPSCMKTKTMITACFAGIGIYLILTGSMSVVASLYMLKLTASGQADRYMALFQFLVLGMPFIGGLLFFAFAPQFAALVCRRSEITEEDRAIFIEPRLAITTACVIAGLMVALSQIPEFVQLFSKKFLMAANPEYAAFHEGENLKILMIRPGIYSVLSIFVLWKAKALAGWLVSKYEKP
jgi:MFS family permease